MGFSAPTRKSRNLRAPGKAGTRDDRGSQLARRAAGYVGKHRATSGVETMKYMIIYERADDGGWGAYPPDIPGIGIVADTKEEARASIRKAIEMHLESLREERADLPKPNTSYEFIEIS